MNSGENPGEIPKKKPIFFVQKPTGLHPAENTLFAQGLDASVAAFVDWSSTLENGVLYDS